MRDAKNDIEGPAAFERFESMMGRLVQVPHTVIQERMAEHRKASEANPKRRGPKPKKQG